MSVKSHQPHETMSFHFQDAGYGEKSFFAPDEEENEVDARKIDDEVFIHLTIRINFFTSYVVHRDLKSAFE